jgi:hypothetical protein
VRYLTPVKSGPYFEKIMVCLTKRILGRKKSLFHQKKPNKYFLIINNIVILFLIFDAPIATERK